MEFTNFGNGADKERLRQELKAVHTELLKNAQKSAEIRVTHEVSNKLRGDNIWMHPSVEKNISDFGNTTASEERKETKKKSKEKKKRKSKKHRKPAKKEKTQTSLSSVKDKRKQKRKKCNHNESYTSSGESDSTDEWVEKPIYESQKSEKILIRDDWMTECVPLKTFSKELIQKKKSTEESYDPSTSYKEGNRYWKNGGNGLPPFKEFCDNDATYQNPYPSTSSLNWAPRGNWRKKTNITETAFDAGNLSDINGIDIHISKSDQAQNEKSPIMKDKQKSMETALSLLTDQQMNELGAKIVKAEIMGNIKEANELTEKLAKAREMRKKNITSNVLELTKDRIDSSTKDEGDDDHVLLTTTDIRGNTRPLLDYRPSCYEKSGSLNDESHYDIRKMFEREKIESGEHMDAQFTKIVGKYKNLGGSYSDVFTDMMPEKISDYSGNNKEENQAIREHERFTRMLEICDRCFDSPKMEKNLIVFSGSTVYLSLPWHKGLQSGHCLISPLQHIPCSTQLDEDTWSEINDIRKALTQMFHARSQDVVFFETARYLNRRPHMVIHCVPSKQFDMAPFYFKKGIQESEQMWSMNKQLISLKEMDVRRAVPKGLPYFWVHFGVSFGFAHVIEDQERFSKHFAEEIIGGLLKLDPRTWRKPKEDHNVIPKVKQFVEWWQKFDCTRQ
ncbi:CWF19-like protein 2 homolog isoform X2 [Hermetia illucens]|uniref:CWF19-like protein 2 homolog isoform X2 n=1 Tax=Hermetia illucens TaxID=343691 RepID=UPI0018CC2F6B|nr:CWF19-like protein 2 homolog isoform X2 [Hermetia illucens]